MTKLVPHVAHWGAFTAVVDDGRVSAIRPVEGDPAPPAMLQSIPDAVHSRVRVDRPEQEAVVERFLAALRTGQLQELMEIMAPDVVLIADGGGLAVRSVGRTACRPGAERYSGPPPGRRRPPATGPG